MSTIKDFCPPVTVHFQEPEKTSRWYYASYGHIKNSHISKVTTKASGNSERMATLMTQISQNKHQLPVSTDSSNSQFSLIYQGFPTFCTPPSQIVWQWEGGVHFIISWVISHPGTQQMIEWDLSAVGSLAYSGSRNLLIYQGISGFPSF